RRRNDAATRVTLSSELLQEAQVVLIEEADVVDAVAQHRHPLEPEPKRRPAVLGGVDLAVFEHDRMDHPAAADLDPTGVLADATAAAVANVAGHVELGARLDERKVAAAKADLA